MLAVHARSLGRALAGAPWAQQAGGLAGVLAERGLARDPVYTAAFPSSSGSSNRAAHSSRRPEVHSTTVLCVRKDGQVVLVADGQVTMGGTVVKPNVRKTRKIGEHVIGGFAGATADALTLFERLESKLEEHSWQLTRACIELGKMWRMDKYLRKLDAALVVADQHTSLQITGNGDVLEPHDGVIAIGSGSPYALSAARALIDMPGMDAAAVAKKAMRIASDACIYTNDNYTSLQIDSEGKIQEIDINTVGGAGGGGAGSKA
ncbi:ATP-dependent protease subunit [Micractinium conductrix]|uniref:ATP-dependent protease subunit n=1 Tax=Micractinium conductrix TaxID=554055 RepID=A0A2P6VH20_9CHLO|nr:ATP-dependent protease subunit [Micractinium conductrix]|eukprot:PSC73383.1 ATP-dependent protease subunit [Micractinium conductrix]